MRQILLALLPVLLAAPAPTQVARLYPVDEAVQQPDLFSFRARLLQAAQARDTAFLYSVLAPDILNSFGGDGGIAEFRESWQPGEPDSRIWRVLTEILSLGGAFVDETLFQAPYTYSSFPAELDAFEHVAVVGSAVRVRQRPSASAPVLAALSFAVVRRAGAGEGPEEPTPAGWVAVRLADGRAGYVAEAFVRSPTDLRIGLVRRDGRWLIRSLVEGD